MKLDVTPPSQKALERPTVQVLLASLVISIVTAAVLQFTGLLYRAELQNINRLFEARKWLCWYEDSLERLNPHRLWEYHQQHEIPRTWWAWDYTLSWLIENNHPVAWHKFVIFNHMLEDEPPQEALSSHPWLKPLMQYPTSRKTIADAIEFLARGGARLIILDNDFPQYSVQDKDIATAIHRASCGELSGTPVPVLMASTVNHRSFGSALQIDATTAPVGVIAELSKLEPGVDVKEKYCGITTVALDEDQVVRRLVTRIPGPDGAVRDSLVLKALSRLHEPQPDNLPALMDIDFACPPNSDIYPVRPFSYLLDPEMRKRLLRDDSGDATIRGSVVLLGDGVLDLYATPETNYGVNLMSGTELLANSIDTISRGSWPRRLSGAGEWLYIICLCVAGSIMIALFPKARFKSPNVVLRTIGELLQYFTIALLIVALSMILFSYQMLIVPVILPAVALSAGATAAIIIERERVRLESLRSRLAAAEANLQAERSRHEAQLQMQAAEAKAQEAAADQRRRKEFVRRINHDLKAPVTVLNWTLAKLKHEGLTSDMATSRLEHLERTSDRLFDLIAQLVRSYDYENTAQREQAQSFSDLCTVLSGCVQIEESLAEMRHCRLKVHLPDYALNVAAPRLDLERVFDNLIRNAVVHNPPGTTIEVEARTRANVVQVKVCDDGIGISKDSISRIFDDGFTTGKPLPGNTSSEGLGLNIVKSIIDKYGGTITVESEEDAGTVFTVSFPFVCDSNLSCTQAPASVPGNTHTGRNI